MEAVLRKGGSSPADVVRLNHYTTDVDAFLAAQDVLVARLREAGCRPTATLLGVSRLAFPPLLSSSRRRDRRLTPALRFGSSPTARPLQSGRAVLDAQGSTPLSELKATLVGRGLPQISEHDVRGVSTRTLLLAGEHSPMFSLCLTDRVEELLPRATRVEIPDASHFAHEDNPRDVNEAILTFLARAASEDAPG